MIACTYVLKEIIYKLCCFTNFSPTLTVFDVFVIFAGLYSTYMSDNGAIVLAIVVFSVYITVNSSVLLKGTW
jgi:hypothetical protein